MNPLKQTLHDISECAEHFYKTFCNSDKCESCPFKDEKHDCFASWLDNIYLDLEDYIRRERNSLGIEK